MEPVRITVEEVKDRMDRGESILFIDTRNPVSWSQSDVKIRGALRIPVGEMEQHLDRLPRDRTIVTY